MTPPNPAHERRFRLTHDFVSASLPAPARLLDVGSDNEMARRMRAAGYTVENTDGDLDDDPDVAAKEAEAVTAFEILEHLVNPLGVLRAATAPRLFATVPMRLWFARAYQNPRDPWDRHYHEFEDWQFDWLLDKAGWTVARRERWISPPSGLAFGVRPLLRRVTPRWYAVEAVRR